VRQVLLGRVGCELETEFAKQAAMERAAGLPL
jgi:hypothetical protein